jgi:stage II sporulation protein D
MVISALRVEIPTTVGAETPAQPDELEIAAAIAAVVSYIDASDNELINGAHIDDTTHNGWQRAAYHEAAGGAKVLSPRRYCKLSPWQASGFLKICLSLPLLCLSLTLAARSAGAQDSLPTLRELPADQQIYDTTAQPGRTERVIEQTSQRSSAQASQQQSLQQQQSFQQQQATQQQAQQPSQAPSGAQGTSQGTAQAPRRSQRDMYSRITPAQGYPFVNGRGNGATGTTQIQSTYSQTNRVSLPFNGPVTTQSTSDDSLSNGDRANTQTPTQTVTQTQVQIQTTSQAAQQPSIITPPARVVTKWALPQAPSSTQQNYDNVGIEPQTVRSTTVIKPAPAAVDPTIQALVQAANQLNPAFANKRTVLKIGLAFANSHLEIAALDGAQVRDAMTGSMVANLAPSSRWDVLLQNSGRGTQLAFFNKRAGDAQVTPRGQDAAPGIAYGDSKYKDVAFYPGARAAANYAPSSIRLPLRLANDSANGYDPSQSSESGYIISPRSGATNSVVAISGKLYRGAVWLKPLPRLVAAGQYRAAAFDVINLVDIEDYLLSVVPSEMPSGWPLEALKAQAIAARSYAVANVGKHGKDGYDLKATIDDQVYSGVSTESDNSNVAVAETSGLVLKHEGKAITAFFHSTSGGSTEFSENVWSKALPYLKSVPDYDDASPHFSWTKRISVDDLEKNVANDIGRLLSLSVVSRTGSNRAQYVLVQGSNGSKLVTGETLRKIYKLPSTLFNVGSETNTYIFAGRGYGHGLGMSQYGAKALAERGCNAAQILSYYYKDVTVDDAATAPSI